jgi:hypothetical protein
MLKIATKLAPETLGLETAYRAGFRYAELFLDAAILAECDAALSRTRHYPFGYALHFPNCAELSAEALRGCVELYRQLGCRSLVIHQPKFDRYQQELLRLEPGLRLAVENHKLNPTQFDEWAEVNSGLTLDVEHLWKFTLRDAPLSELLDRVRTFLSRWADKLRHVHLPGYWPGLREHRPMYCARDLVLPVLSLLAEHRFDGLIVSEVNPEYQNLTELHMDMLLFEVWRHQHDGKR